MNRDRERHSTVPQRVTRAAALTILVVVLGGSVVGQPILVGFVETGSMEPTIDAGDGFVALPAELTGDPEPGDVVVYDAEELDGGGLTTHRIVEETDRGYVTSGDANPFTDQDGGEPHVQDSQIVATTLQVRGDPVTIPRLGGAVTTVSDRVHRAERRLAAATGTRHESGPASLLVILSVAVYAFDAVRERRDARRSSSGGERGDEDSVDPRLVAGAFAILLATTAGAAMLVPSGTQSYDVVSAEFDSDRPLVIERGTTNDVPHRVSNGGFVPVVAYVESESETVALESETVTLAPREATDVSLAVSAPAETGHYPTSVTEHRYLHVLPVPVVDALHDVHPWTPFVTIVGLLGSSGYGLSRALIGQSARRSRRRRSRRERSRSRTRTPITAILRRWF